MEKFKRFSPGDLISAADFNAMMDSIEQLQAEVNHLRTASTAEMIFDRPLKSRIVARSGVDPDGTGLEPQVKYSVKVMDLGITVTNAVPTYGRPLRASGAMVPRIRAANIDDVCWTIRRKESNGSAAASEFMIFEEIAAAACGSGAGASVPSAQQMIEARQGLNLVSASGPGGQVSIGGVSPT